MELQSFTGAQWLVVAGVALLAAVAGLLIGRRAPRDPTRVAELEDELREAHEQLAGYQAEVTAHFNKTSDLLKEMTLQYRSIYDHLSEGARSLCPGEPQVSAGAGKEALPEGEVRPQQAAEEDGEADEGAEAASGPEAEKEPAPRPS